jgi:hypothetical protein
MRVCPEFIEGTNGGAVEIVGDFPFMLSIVEAFLGFSAESETKPNPLADPRAVIDRQNVNAASAADCA